MNSGYYQYPNYYPDNNGYGIYYAPDLIRQAIPKINYKKKCHYCDCNKSLQLIENDEGFWCKNHYENLYGIADLQVKIDNKLCHCYGCTKNKKLSKGYDGLWCKIHYKKINDLSYIYDKDNTYFKHPNRRHRTANLMRIYGIRWCESQYAKISEGLISRPYHEAIYESDMCVNMCDDVSDSICYVNNNIVPVQTNKMIWKPSNNISPIEILDIKSTKEIRLIQSDNNLGLVVKTDKEIIPIRPDIGLVDNVSSKITQILLPTNKKVHITYPNLFPKNNNVCCAHECKMYTQLIEKHQGKWCLDHYKEITELRKIIKKHTGGYDEMIARLKELNLRKNVDPQHKFWAFKLLNYHINSLKKIEI